MIRHMTFRKLNTLHKLKFNRVDANLRWVHFESAPWIGNTGARVSVFVVFADGKRKIDELRLKTSSGMVIPAEVDDQTSLPQELSQFNELPESFRNFYKVSFNLAGPEVVVGVGLIEKHEVPLFTLIPKIEHPDFLFDILCQAASSFPDTEFSTFVETGTLYGHTAIHAACMFEHVYSIELNEQLNSNAKAISSCFPQIQFIQGDSGVEIAKLINRISSPTIFFLDAHWSGDKSVDWQSSEFSGYPTDTSHLGNTETVTPSSQEQVPLDRELEIVLSRFPHEAIIIIDDWQSIGERNNAFAGEDWSHLSKQSLLEQFDASPRKIFHYPYDDKHYILGIRSMAESPDVATSNVNESAEAA